MDQNEFVVPVQTLMINYLCPKCKDGAMMYQPGAPTLATHPRRYPHKCAKCGYTESYSIIYPKITYQPIMINDNSKTRKKQGENKCTKDME